MPNATQRRRANRIQGRRRSNSGRPPAAQPSRANVNGNGKNGANNAAGKRAPHIVAIPQHAGAASAPARPRSDSPSIRKPPSQAQSAVAQPETPASVEPWAPAPVAPPTPAVVPVLTPLPAPEQLEQSAPATSQHAAAEEATQLPPSTPGSAQPAAPSTPAAYSRNPRIIAALCYAVPFLPALATIMGLLGERRNRFIRAHAIQSMLFFAALAGIQITIFIAVVALGATLPLDWFGVSVALGLIFYALTIGVGIVAFLLWTALIYDALGGHLRLYPLLTSAALLVERWAASFDLDNPDHPQRQDRQPTRRRLQPTSAE